MEVNCVLPFARLLSVARDKHGVEHHLLIVKATFDILPGVSAPAPAAEQIEITAADAYHGEPGKSSIRDAHDMARTKPLIDFVVSGSAHSPNNEPATKLRARLSVGNSIEKAVEVVGDRHWVRSHTGTVYASEPEPFINMPLVFDRAYGGSYVSEDGTRQSWYPENPVGVGCYGSLDAGDFIGTPLPNIFPIGSRINNWGDRSSSCGFSFLSPATAPRVGFAGTYDQKWLDDHYPLLPPDFDDRFEQSAPEDQQLDRLEEGELVSIENMTADGKLDFVLPSLHLPATFLVKDEPDIRLDARADTIVVLPDARKLTVTWRASIPCRRKFHALRKVVVGERSDRWFRLQRSAKTYYGGLDELVRASRQSK
jgi:hypothetical protein